MRFNQAGTPVGRHRPERENHSTSRLIGRLVDIRITEAPMRSLGGEVVQLDEALAPA